MARRGRKPKSKDQKLRDALERSQPADYILERRKLFSFAQPQPRPGQGRSERSGEIDQDVCDTIGQLHILGLLDNNGYDPIELRDKGRFWGGHYAKLMKGVGVKAGGYERRDRSKPSGALTGDDLLFDKMDANLGRFERTVLLSLVVDPLIGHEENVPWAQSLIAEALLERKRVVKFLRFPDANDRELLKAAIRGLCQLTEGSLPSRWEQRRVA